MNLGEIYKWNTTKVVGYTTRDKYHVFICASDSSNDNGFLFINSVEWFGDYQITKADYGFLAYDSFIGCNSLIPYSDAEVAAMGPGQPVGCLSKDHIKGLRDALIGADSMIRYDLNRACKALADGM
ncbi:MULTISPECIES: hypothetical protein [unclassified Bradyrhizobium]|uniref:hypothetical protein n=1 Tax=unclassified Bradyrhizobium TaxID=2631580 RepID=UPI002916665C|nr:MULTISPECIES: hypothetical protein [unclassified Bradyrhizobium]